MSEFVAVLQLTELPPGSSRVVTVGEDQVALFNVRGEIYAIANLCPHEGGPLASGRIRGTVVTCPWHRWQFDLVTGISPVNPALRVKTFPVRKEEETIFVSVDDQAGQGIWS